MEYPNTFGLDMNTQCTQPYWHKVWYFYGWFTTRRIWTWNQQIFLDLSRINMTSMWKKIEVWWNEVRIISPYLSRQISKINHHKWEILKHHLLWIMEGLIRNTGCITTNLGETKNWPKNIGAEDELVWMVRYEQVCLMKVV